LSQSNGFPNGKVDENSGYDLLIGESIYQQRAFEGSIDEVRIWGDIRTQSEILSNMYRHLTGNENDLLAYYTFNDGTAYDFANNGNTGEVYGASLINHNMNIWHNVSPSSGSLSSNSQDDIVLNINSIGLSAGIYESELVISGNDPYNPMILVPINLEVVEAAKVEIKAFLEGPFMGFEMLNQLNFFEHLPYDQPYYELPWDYNGNESVYSISNSDIVDWILIELRESSGDVSTAIPDSIIATKAGFILRDGTITDLSGTDPLAFNVVVQENLYAILYHKNHLPIISSIPLDVNNGIYSYDFTTGSDKAFGGTSAQKELSTGVWGMISSDGNSDGQINNQDKNDIWLLQNGNSGYLEGDFNMNGTVDEQDKMQWEPNTGKGTQIPE